MRLSIDNGLLYGYIIRHPVRRGTFREGTFESGTGAVPARGVTTRARAALGIIHAGTTAGAGGAVPGLGQAKAGNARQNPRPRKHGLELSQQAHGPLARAAAERRKVSASRWTRAAARDGVAATRSGLTRPMVGSAFWRSASLSFGGEEIEGLSCRAVKQTSDANASRERFLTSSLPDLIRQSMLRSRSLLRLRRFSMDHRVEPGGDGVWVGIARMGMRVHLSPRAGRGRRAS